MTYSRIKLVAHAILVVLFCMEELARVVIFMGLHETTLWLRAKFESGINELMIFNLQKENKLIGKKKKRTSRF